ncbi:MAG: hypothetical protein NZ473_09305, partial [Candidatus Kapabacteria bacterium]|nr:hypothetical protein [Candidatus Kapabacteria bacterium]
LLHVAGTGRFDGNVTIGDAAADQLTVNAGTIMLTNVPSGSSSHQVLLLDGSNQVRQISASSLVSTSAWALAGNSITGTEFLGTTNAQPLVVRTNNVERLRVTATGNVGIGTNSPSALLHVAGTAQFDGAVTAVADVTVQGNTVLGDAAADQLTVNAGTVLMPNLPTGTTTDVVLLRGPGNQVRQLAASALIAAHAWVLPGNTGTTAWNGTTGNFVGHNDAQPLV